MSEVFDESLSLKRLFVALKREDWRMFEQALEKLKQEIEADYPFQRHKDWQAFYQIAEASEPLSDALKAELADTMALLLSVEVTVPQRAEAAEAEATAIVVGWHSTLRDPALLQAFREWLTGGVSERTASAARELIERWLADPKVTLETLVNRANLTLAAAYGGIATTDPHWVDTLMAGLSYVLTQRVEKPPLTRLLEGLPPGPVSLLTVEPSLVWERFYKELAFRRTPEEAAEGGMRLVKLAGSLDWFYCHSCFHFASGTAGELQPLAVACPRCAAPAWPLLVPADNPHILPPAIRNIWAWGGEVLREATTWVLVDPPAPSEGSFQAWLLASASAETRVLVMGKDEQALADWRRVLEAKGVGSVVTSRGPADEVAGFLLSGGAPGMKDEPVKAASGGKKKGKR